MDLVIPDEVLLAIKKANSKCPSVMDKLQKLEKNPLAVAIKTGIPVIGEYYVNCGRYCLIYNINNEDECVNILSCLPSPRLHKLKCGWIKPSLS